MQLFQRLHGRHWLRSHSSESFAEASVARFRYQPSNRNILHGVILQGASALRRFDILLCSGRYPLLFITPSRRQGRWVFSILRWWRCPEIPIYSSFFWGSGNSFPPFSSPTCAFYTCKELTGPTSRYHPIDVVIWSVIPISRINFLPSALTDGDERRRHSVIQPFVVCAPYLCHFSLEWVTKIICGFYWCLLSVCRLVTCLDILSRKQKLVFEGTATQTERSFELCQDMCTLRALSVGCQAHC